MTFPLTVLGGIMGKNTRMEFNPPTRTTKCALSLPLNRLVLHLYSAAAATSSERDVAAEG